MSTNAFIVVNVENLQGKFAKLNEKLLPCSVVNMDDAQELMCNLIKFGRDDINADEWKELVKKTSFEPFKKVKIKGKYMYIYHHWDGHTDSLGAELLENYNTFEKALNLMCLGSVSSIMCGGYRGYPQNIQPYILRNNTINDSKVLWEENKPKFIEDWNELDNEFVYAFENGRWYYKYWGDNITKKLKNNRKSK